MKVLLINGSPRKKGNTFLALSEAAKTLEQQGIDTEIVQIGVKPVRGCIACAQCKIKQLDRCVFDDDVCNRISEKLDDVDALIVGSPVYYVSPTALCCRSSSECFSRLVPRWSTSQLQPSAYAVAEELLQPIKR